MDKKEFKKDIDFLVDSMYQIEAHRDAINDRKKEMKKKYDLSIPMINKIATIVKKQNIEDIEADWAELQEYLQLCL